MIKLSSKPTECGANPRTAGDVETMGARRGWRRWWIVILALVLAARSAMAQDDADPFAVGDDDAVATAPEDAAPADNATSAESAPDESAAAATADAETDAFGNPADAGADVAAETPAAGETRRRGGVPTPPPTPTAPSALADAIEVLNPSSPAELFRAMDQLIRAERPEFAKTYLTKLIELKLNDVALVQLHQQFGSAAMLRLSHQSELAPEGGQFARQVMQAATTVGRDPARLAQWADQLGAADRQVQFRAAQHLLRAGAHAVEPVVRRMAKEPQAPAARLGAELLSHLGEEAVEPLIALLDSDDSSLRAMAATGLGTLSTPRVAVYLIQPLFAPRDSTAESTAAATAIRRALPSTISPDRASGVQLVRDAAARAYAGNVSGRLDSDDRMSRWLCDASTGHLRAAALTTRAAADLEAARLYQALARLEPSDVVVQDVAWISRLQLAQTEAGDDVEMSPADHGQWLQDLDALDPAHVNRLLDRALRDGKEDAVIALANHVGKTHVSPGELLTDGADGAPLVRALTHANRRVRFAATGAITRLQPPASFAGASRYAENLAYFAAARGRSQVIVAHPNISYASQLAGLFNGRGYQAQAVDREADLLRTAAQSPDVEFLLVSEAMNGTSAWSLIESLRADPKTARLPVVVLARRDSIEQVEHLTTEQARTIAWVENLQLADLSGLIPQIEAARGRDRITAERRLEQAVAAINWLNERLRRDQYAAADVAAQQSALIRSLDQPALALPAVDLLASLGVADAQVALLDLASQSARPLAVRQAAAAGFARSHAAFGSLLTPAQRVRQYDRYNQSRYSDAATQQLLSGVLDVLESTRQPK